MATVKTCFKCHREKALAQFYRHAWMADGHLNKCIECTKRDVKMHRIANLAKIQAYDQVRGALPHRIAARKQYASTPGGKAAHAKALKRNRAKFPDRYEAHVAIRNAIRDGRVVPWPVCAVPECDGKPHGHHADYSRPLDVVWLCPTHHRAVHALVA